MVTSSAMTVLYDYGLPIDRHIHFLLTATYGDHEYSNASNSDCVFCQNGVAEGAVEWFEGKTWDECREKYVNWYLNHKKEITMATRPAQSKVRHEVRHETDYDADEKACAIAKDGSIYEMTTRRLSEALSTLSDTINHTGVRLYPVMSPTDEGDSILPSARPSCSELVEFLMSVTDRVERMETELASYVARLEI